MCGFLVFSYKRTRACGRYAATDASRQRRARVVLCCACVRWLRDVIMIINRVNLIDFRIKRIRSNQLFHFLENVPGKQNGGLILFLIVTPPRN